MANLLQYIKDKGYGLKVVDFLKGAVMAIGTPVLYLVQEMIPGYDIPPIYKAGASALVTYLIKNFFTDDVKVAKKVIAKDEAKRSNS